jgi:hypothetical protein
MKKNKENNHKKKKKGTGGVALVMGPEKPQHSNNSKKLEAPWSRVMFSCTPLLPYPVSLQKS